MLAIGNNELGRVLGESVSCPHCGESHAVENSAPSITYKADGSKTAGPAGLLQFYRCGDKSYVCGLQGRAVPNA